jgi:hypothetical protein
MEVLNTSTAAVTAHALMTVVAWLVGVAVGGGCGALIGLGIRVLLSGNPGWSRAWVLLPWRTLVLLLLMGVWSPRITTHLGIGPTTGGVIVAGSVCLLAAAFTTTQLVGFRHPAPLGARLIGGARTLAVAAGLFATAVGPIGGGGLGNTILEAARLAQTDLIWRGVLPIVGLALALDLALGLAQRIPLQQYLPASEPTATPGGAL